MIGKKSDNFSSPIRMIAVFFLVIAVWIAAHLFSLQILEHGYYTMFAFNAHEIYKKLHPERGTIFFQDTRNHTTFPVALNRPYHLVYAVPKEMISVDLSSTTRKIFEILHITDEDKKKIIEQRLQKKDSWYQVIDRRVDEDMWRELQMLNLPGIYSSVVSYRYYPEENLGSALLGFCTRNDEDNSVGQYGTEGYWNTLLTGKVGYVAGERGRAGSWITLVGRSIVPAQDGANIVLTIDRTLQYQSCKRLAEGMKAYKAKSAALIIMNAKTGAIVSMCSLPDFNLNEFSQVNSVNDFNNQNIFTAYEPGSVFKPMVMAAAIDQGIVGPNTTFTDPCKWEVKGSQPIYNAERMCYGLQTMTQVLENSINTGMAWVQKQLGLEKTKQYIQKFGFGKKTGITLDTEVSGNITSLDTYAVNGIYASFGQSIAVTPLQLAMAYAALANEGNMTKPYIVDEIHYSDGRIEQTQPTIVDRVISERTAKLITGMLVSVIEKKYFRVAKLDHYFLAGKTGTAQIAKSGGSYQENVGKTNHTFVGYGPSKTTPYVVVVKYEEPAYVAGQQYAEHTAAPVFRDIMKLLLDYYAIPAER